MEKDRFDFDRACFFLKGVRGFTAESRRAQRVGIILSKSLWRMLVRFYHKETEGTEEVRYFQNSLSEYFHTT